MDLLLRKCIFLTVMYIRWVRPILILLQNQWKFRW